MHDLEYTDDVRERILMRAYAVYLKIPGVRRVLDELPRGYRFNSHVLLKLREVSDSCIGSRRMAPEDVLSAYLNAGGLEKPLTKVLNDEDYRFENLPMGTLQDTVNYFIAAQLTSDIDEVTEDYRLGRINRAEYAYSIKAISDGEDTTPLVRTFAEIREDAKNQKFDPAIDVLPEWLNVRMKGLRRKRVTLLAARPGIGKTDFALYVTRLALQKGYGVLFVSMEMDAFELGNRMQNATVLENSAYLDKLAITEKGTLRVSQIASVTDKYDLVIVDYLQKLTPTGKYGSMYEKATVLSEELRLAAKNSDAAWMVLSQLARPHDRSSKKDDENYVPRLSELRDSGALEQDAYAVLLMHEPLPRNIDASPPESSRMVKVTIAKNRGGGQGGFSYRFTMGESRWHEMRRDEVEDWLK